MNIPFYFNVHNKYIFSHCIMRLLQSERHTLLDGNLCIMETYNGKCFKPFYINTQSSFRYSQLSERFRIRIFISLILFSIQLCHLVVIQYSFVLLVAYRPVQCCSCVLRSFSLVVKCVGPMI